MKKKPFNQFVQDKRNLVADQKRRSVYQPEEISLSENDLLFNKNGLNVFIYTRISDRERAIKGYGLENQKVACIRFLKIQKYKIANAFVFHDDGYSGGTINRPAFQCMMDNINNYSNLMILSWKQDRLSRDVSDINNLIRYLRSHEIDVQSVIDVFDTDSANGRFRLSIQASADQWERENAKERTEAALIRKAEIGEWPLGYIPLGYKKINKCLEIDPETSRYIIMIHELAADGFSFVQIAQKLKEKYDVQLSYKQIKIVLLRSLYTGNFVFKGRTFLNVVPKIVSPSLKNISKQMIGRHFHDISKMHYLLGNRVKCICNTLCEKSSTNKPSRTYYYYYCPKCKKRLNQDYILARVVPELMSQKDKIHQSDQIKKLFHQIMNLKQRMDSLTEQMVEGNIDVKPYAVAITELEKKRKLCSIKLNQQVYLPHFTEMSLEEQRILLDTHVQCVYIDTTLKIVTSIKYMNMEDATVKIK